MTGRKPDFRNKSFCGISMDCRDMEQVLICAYTIEALDNARYEIAKKNYKNFDKEMERVSSLLKLPGKKELEEIINKRRN